MSLFLIEGHISEQRSILCYRDMVFSTIGCLRTGRRLMGAVEAGNKNIKRILRKMVETSRDWS